MCKFNQYHYAPISGGLLKFVDGKPVKTNNWPDFHKTMNEFLTFRAVNKIKLVEEINFGHELFSGGCGKVLVYE